jgi:hypothetical protein
VAVAEAAAGLMTMTSHAGLSQRMTTAPHRCPRTRWRKAKTSSPSNENS